jgi:hypothetical protein
VSIVLRDFRLAGMSVNKKKKNKKEIKKKFKKEQPIIDIQNQIHRIKDAALGRSDYLIPERAEVIDAFFTFV